MHIGQNIAYIASPMVKTLALGEYFFNPLAGLTQETLS